MNGSAEVLFGYRDIELVDKNIQAIIPDWIPVRYATDGKRNADNNHPAKLSLETSGKKKTGIHFLLRSH